LGFGPALSLPEIPCRVPPTAEEAIEGGTFPE